MLKVPTPRLLPATIAAMGVLLIVKCGGLLQAALTHGAAPDGVMVTTANAASTEQVKESAKPEAPSKPAASEASPAPSPPGAHMAPGPASGPKPVAEGPPPVSDSEKALLQELRQRR